MAADDAHDRISHNNYDSLLEYETLAAGLTWALATRDVVFFAGHGNWEFYAGGLGPNFLGMGPDPFLLSEELFSWVNLPVVVSTDLFFTLACGSGLWGVNTIAYHAIARGAGAYAGFTGNIETTIGILFTQYFFDYAVNGETFTDSMEYALDKTGLLSAEFELYGDGALTAYDSAPSFSLSSQRYTHYVGATGWEATVSSEPLWGEDIDSFRTTVAGNHEIEIYVYTSPECKVEMTIYYWRNGYYWRYLKSRESSSPGASFMELISTTSTREYLIVFEQTDGHGGWYTFSFNPILS